MNAETEVNESQSMRTNLQTRNEATACIELDCFGQFEVSEGSQTQQVPSPQDQ